MEIRHQGRKQGAEVKCRVQVFIDYLRSTREVNVLVVCVCPGWGSFFPDVEGSAILFRSEGMESSFPNPEGRAQPGGRGGVCPSGSWDKRPPPYKLAKVRLGMPSLPTVRLEHHPHTGRIGTGDLGRYYLVMLIGGCLVLPNVFTLIYHQAIFIRFF